MLIKRSQYWATGPLEVDFVTGNSGGLLQKPTFATQGLIERGGITPSST